MRSVSNGSTFQERGAEMEKGVCQLYEAEYVKQKSCLAHWTEAVCHQSVGRVLTVS